MSNSFCPTAFCCTATIVDVPKFEHEIDDAQSQFLSLKKSPGKVMCPLVSNSWGES